MIPFNRFTNNDETLRCSLINSVLGLNFCPVCSKMSIFEPFGKTERPRAQCKNCKSVERHRVLFMLLMDRLGMTIPMKALYIGSDKVLRKNLPKNIDLAEIELSSDSEKTIDLSGFKDETFDIIVCGEHIGHFSDDAKFLSAVAKTLRKDGVFVTLFSPGKENETLSETEQEPMTWSPSPLRTYSQDLFEELLLTDFKYDSASVNDIFSDEQIKLCSLKSRQIYYYCEKR